MPFDLAVISDDVAEALVEYAGHEFRVRYHPGKYDDGFHKHFSEATARESVNYYLTELLASWDLVRAGAPIPLTAEGVETIPLPIKLKIVRAVEADVLNPTITAPSPPASAPTATSSAGTPPAASSAEPNGHSAIPIGSGSAT